MNFIIKSVLKKIFTQYLYIQDEGLDLTSGILKLPQGNINQTRINQKLEPFGLRIALSSYKNLIIHLPIVELMSKPIRISIEVLNLIIEKVYKNEEQAQRKQSQSSVESQAQPILQKTEAKNEPMEDEKQGGYFRNIINRLLYNIEIVMDKINIRFIDIKEEEEFREAYFTLDSFKLKNSLVILEANIVKKTLTLDQLHLRHAIGEVIVKDFSLCLDFSHKKLQVITVGSSIRVNIFKIPFNIIIKHLKKMQPKKQVAKQKKSLTLIDQLTIFLKLGTLQFSFQLVEAEINSIQVKNKTNDSGTETCVKFRQIKISKIGRQRQQNHFIGIDYLPFSKLVKINSQFQDSAIKECCINFKIESGTDFMSINTQVYHLSVNISIDECQNLLDQLISKERELQKIRTIFILVNKTKKNQKIQVQQEQKQTKNLLIDALLYRASLAITYGKSKVQIFGSALFQIKEQAPTKQLSLKKSLSRQNNRQIEKQSQLVTLLKVYQLGVRAFNRNLIEISDLHAKLTQKQLVINGNSILSQLSLSCIDQAKKQIDVAQRDVAYYTEKLKKIFHVQSQRKQNQKPQKEAIEELPFPQKVFLKFDETILSIGELAKVQIASKTNQPQRKYQEEQKFISIIDVELSKLLFSLVSNKVKISAEAIVFISSPYTLQRTPLTNELQFQASLGIFNNQLNISFKNKLVFIIQDHYINIIYKILDKKDVWCCVVNQTNENILLLQNISEFNSLFIENQEQLDSSKMIEENGLHYGVNVEAKSSRHVFWISDGTFKIAMGNRHSKQISSKMVEPEVCSKNDRFCFTVTKELVFLQGKEYDYILKFSYNKLGNLCEIVIDYKTLISSFCKDYIFKIGSKSFKVEKSRRQKWQWFLQLQDLTQDFQHYEITTQDKRALKIEQLMAHQQFNIMGIYQTIQIEQTQTTKKIYEAYIYQNKVGNQLKYSIMPLLIIANNCIEDFQLEIIDKKSQEKQVISLKSKQTIELGHNGKFDYYLKQFTIKISVLSKEEVIFQSEPLYFNTFFMVDNKTQTNVQLRSTQKNNYSKRSLFFQESLLLKTKIITLRSSLHINNFTDFNFTIQAKQVSKSSLQKIDINSHSTAEWTHRIKQDSILEFWINKNYQSKVEVRYEQLKYMKLLSFNFCKIQDRFFNVFVRVQRRNLEGIQTIMMDHFIELINLCNYTGPVKLQDFPPFQNGVRTNLPLNSTSLNKYNNKPVDLDDIGKIYAQIFLTPKVTDQPLCFLLGRQSIKFQSFLKESSLQLQIQRNKFIITLLKDMNNNKITFYLTDRLFNQKLHYTIFNNETKAHFLLTDDFQYAPHFSNIQQNCSTVPQKVLIANNSFNCLVNRENYDILLCDKHETHLQKLDKKVLEKEGIRLQQYNFDAITLFDCVIEEQKSVRKQFTAKEVEIKIRMYGKVQLSFSLQALTLRLLEAGKLDCLIQDISIKNEESKDHLLRIPEQTYLLVQGRLLQDGYFILIKNLFVKCKNVIVNIKRQMPYSLIELMTTLSERLGLNIDQSQLAQKTDPRRYRQQIKKMNGETKLRNHIKEDLLLIKNLYVHEIHLSLTIELENLSFSNVIILPFFQVQNKFQRLKSFADNLTNFYLTALLAKFPKLSFLMSNFKSPLNTLRLFFNVRQALRMKVENEPIINLGHSEFSSNPFHFSVQRWNVMHSSIVGDGSLQIHQNEQIISFLFQGKRCMILTNLRIYWLDEQWTSWGLRDLQGLKINKNRVSSQVLLKFKGNQQLILVEEHKKCVKLLNNIQKLLL